MKRKDIVPLPIDMISYFVSFSFISLLSYIVDPFVTHSAQVIFFTSKIESCYAFSYFCLTAVTQSLLSSSKEVYPDADIECVRVGTMVVVSPIPLNFLTVLIGV